ncbi:MAG: nickel insertion protein, partial [Kiritimatiellia bacterium]
LVEQLERLVFVETTAIGLRKYPVERTVMRRQMVTVPTRAGLASVKICRWGDVVRFYPEHESISELSKRSGVAYPLLYSEATIEAQRLEGIAP